MVTLNVYIPSCYIYGQQAVCMLHCLPLHMQLCISWAGSWYISPMLADILTALDHRLDAKWRHFGTFLRVEYQVLEVIQRDKGGNPEDCMLDLLSKWTSNQAGLGTLPRTWQTVLEAVHHCGDGALAQSLARKHGGQLPQ